jgi:MFS family permease
VFSISRTFVLSMAVLFVAGYSQISFIATANSRIQTITPDHLRGRVMSLYAQALMGVGPVGAIQAGALATRFGAPFAMAIGAVVAGAVILGIWLVRPQVFAPVSGVGAEPSPDPDATSRPQGGPPDAPLESTPPR